MMSDDAKNSDTRNTITSEADCKKKPDDTGITPVALWGLLRNRLSSNATAVWLFERSTEAMTLIGFFSALLTFGGTSLPAIRDKYFPQFSEAVRSIPIISGRYTFCSDATKQNRDADSRLFNFLYDIRQSEKKIVFFDIILDSDCSVGQEPPRQGEVYRFSRQLENQAVTYEFHFPVIKANDRKAVAAVLSGGRDITKFPDRYSDNGSYLRFDSSSGSNNVFSKMALNIEGVEDRIYGPYQVKIVEGEASSYYELTAPVLDSAAATAVTYIDEERLKTHKRTAPKKVMPAVSESFSLDEWQRDVQAGVQFPIPEYIEKRDPQTPNYVPSSMPPLPNHSEQLPEKEVNRLFRARGK